MTRRVWDWCCRGKTAWYNQALGRRALLWLILLVSGLILVRIYSGMDRHTFGHPAVVDWLTLGLLTLLGLTHVVIATIMYLQRERWLPSDAAMFLFIGVKAMLWINLATSYVFTGRGVRLDIAYLYVAILVTTSLLDYRMFRRYVLATPDEREVIELERVA